MSQKDIELLLTDLCGRLPSGLIVERLGVPRKVLAIHPYNASLLIDRDEYMPAWYKLDEVKPYLRSMSSMTEEEREEYKKFGLIVVQNYDGVILPNINEIDWLNAHHFDFRNLIEKGLAIEAPEDIYRK